MYRVVGVDKDFESYEDYQAWLVREKEKARMVEKRGRKKRQKERERRESFIRNPYGS